MGWTFTHRPKRQPTAEFFRAECGEGVVDAAATLTEAYLAYQVRDRETGEANGVICIVCLIRWVRDDYFNFGYKDMEECAGPWACNCPERILRQLTDFDFGSEEANQRSREWRARCWERIRQQKARPRLSKGMVIRFGKPLSFSSGDELSEFVVISTRPLRFGDARYPHHWRRYRIRRDSLQSSDWEVIGEIAPDGSRREGCGGVCQYSLFPGQGLANPGK